MRQRLGQTLTLCIGLLLVVSVAFVPLAFDPTDPGSYMVGKQQAIWGTALLVVILWLARLLVARDQAPRVPLRLVVPFGAFAGALVIATWRASNPFMSLWGSMPRGEGLVTMISYLVVSLATAAELRDSRPMRRRWIAALLVGAMGNAIYALIQFAGLDPAWGYLGFLRPFAMMDNAVFLAGYLAMATPVALSAVLIVRGWPARTGVLVLAAVLHVGLLVTGSRIGLASVWLAAGAVAAFVLRHRTRDAGRWIMLAGSAFAALTLAYFVPGGPFARHIDETVLQRVVRDGGILRTVPGETHPDARQPAERLAMTLEYGGGVAARLSVWRGAIKSWQRRPIFGQGLDSFRYFPNLGDPREARLYAGRPLPPDFRYDRVHNEFLEVAVAAGTVGLLAFLWLLTALLFPSLRAALTSGDPLTAGLLAGALAYLLVLQFQPGYLASSFVFWSLVGFGAARAR